MTEHKCPHCGSNSFKIEEYYTYDYILKVINGKVIAQGRGKYIANNNTLCQCDKCGHWWRPENIEYTVDIGEIPV